MVVSTVKETAETPGSDLRGNAAIASRRNAALVEKIIFPNLAASYHSTFPFLIRQACLLTLRHPFAVFPFCRSLFTWIIASVRRPCSPVEWVLSMMMTSGLPSGWVIRHTVRTPKT